MNTTITKRSLLNSFGVVAYVAVVASLMINGERLFGEMQSLIARVAFLLLFCISAAIVGSLVFGYPVMLFMNGQKREAMTALIVTIAWLAGETVVAIAIASLRP